MNMLFVDTSGWVAAANAKDPRHSGVCAARDGWLANRGFLVTTDYVIDETLTTIRSRAGLDVADDWWRQIEASRWLRIERIIPEQINAALSLFFRYRDKDFSFTDCTSFVVMEELGTRKALTLDRHFAQMGFEMVPGSL